MAEMEVLVMGCLGWCGDFAGRGRVVELVDHGGRRGEWSRVGVKRLWHLRWFALVVHVSLKNIQTSEKVR